MKSLSSVGLGLSVVFGCLFLALVVEIYYLLWWKKRVTLTGRVIEDDDGNPAREILYIFCCKTKKLRSTTLTSQELRINKDLYLFDENCVEAGLLMGPPRFLFTIKEETKEDLESEDGKSKKLSDLMRNDDTPYMTPLSSPALFTPPLTPSMGSSQSNGYNPFYESSSDVEFIKMKSSPLPRFKFLRDAEEKLRRKNTVEEGKRENNVLF